MAIQHTSFGKSGGVLINYGNTAGTGAADLGYSRNGVDIVVEQFWEDIESDDFGGQGGHPADRQFLGAVAKITTELTKYSRVDVQKLLSYDSGGTGLSGTTLGGVQGVLPDIGTFVRQDALLGPLVLTGATLTRTYPLCYVSEAFEESIGTKNSVYMIKWEAWIDSVAGMVLFTEA